MPDKKVQIRKYYEPAFSLFLVIVYPVKKLSQQTMKEHAASIVPHALNPSTRPV